MECAQSTLHLSYQVTLYHIKGQIVACDCEKRHLHVSTVYESPGDSVELHFIGFLVKRVSPVVTTQQ